MAAEWSELTGFQRDVLAVVAHLERSDDRQYGLAIKSDIEARYGAAITPARLYQNLDDLVDLGLVEKWFYDGRTNRYRLTDDGDRVMQAYAVQLFADLDPDLDGVVDGESAAPLGSEASPQRRGPDESSATRESRATQGPPEPPESQDPPESQSEPLDAPDRGVSVSGSAR